MSSGRLSHDEFFRTLTDLFESRRQKDHGTVLLTQKRMSYQQASSPGTTPTEDPRTPPAFPILIRATNAKNKAHRADKLKISTLVEADQLEGFYLRYAEVCKVGMSGLKKRDRSKAKEKQKAAKKKQKLIAGAA